MYFNVQKLKCIDKKYENQTCQISDECNAPMKCLDSLCHCRLNEYFDQNEFKCLNKSLANTNCVSDRTCNNHLGLTCQYFKCQCDLNKKYWSKSENKCVDLFKYGEVGCESSNQCYEDLICDDFNGKCLCKHDFYWDAKSCVARDDMGKRFLRKKNLSVSQSKPFNHFKIIMINFVVIFYADTNSNIDNLNIF